MWISTSIVAIVLIASLAALCGSAWCLWTTRKRHRHMTYEKRLSVVEDEQMIYLDRLDKVTDQLKKLYGREAMRKARAKRHADPEPEETDDEWKARMAREMAIGRTNGALK